MNDSLKISDQAAEAVAVAPRVKLEDIENAIAIEYTVMAGDACRTTDVPAHSSLDLLTVHFVVMKNGFTVIGKSAPASPENYNAELGRKFAREDAIRQLWPIMGYALRETLMKEKSNG